MDDAKHDRDKLDLTLVPRQVIWDVAEVRRYGVKKYHDPENWKRVEIERYRSALFRHLLAYLENPEGKDEESGIEHYKHMACNIAFICELEKHKPEKQVDALAVIEAIKDSRTIQELLAQSEW